MLKTLRIEYLALIDQAEFDFEKGLICFTGETGAGKSIFLSALRLLAGNRSERLSLRPGSEQGKIEGLFCFTDPILEKINALCQANDIPTCEAGELILRRTFGARTKVSINGCLAPLALLKQLGVLWLEFHTPNEPQRLFLPEIQLDLLDKFAQLEAEKTQYIQQYQAYCEAEQQLKDFQKQVNLSPEALEFAQNQLQTLGQIDLSQSAVESLERDFKRISQREEGLDALKELDDIFNREGGCLSQLDHLQNALHALVQCTPHLASLLDQYQQVRIELQDIEATCMQERDAFNLDLEQCEQIQRTMNLWLELQRRYGPTLEQVVEAKQNLKERVYAAQHSEEQLQQLTAISQQQEALCRSTALQLHAHRQECLPALTQQVEQCLKQLGFPHPKFHITLSPTKALNAQGCSRICFEFASDHSLSCMPIQNIASSGELSRLLLAIKNVLQDTQNTPVLVFDEIDANVGGEMGTKVGEMLKKLGQNAQIFCVTHLPQVAGQAQAHYCVTKVMQDIPTIQFTQLIRAQDRLNELARMLGDTQSVSAQQHAKTLLVEAPDSSNESS